MSAAIGDDPLKTLLLTRPATYMVGEFDTLPVAGFDSSRPAMAQGQHPLARGTACTDCSRESYGAQPAFMMIPLCGHKARCMFTADNALPVLFPKQ